MNVVFDINEGDRTKIAAINFVGNNAFSDRRLSDVIATKRSNFLSFVLRDDIYDEDRLRADEEALRRFYYNRGYADFQVVSAFGELDEATNEYTVTITVEEGERYTFGDISVDSTIPDVDAKSLQSVVETACGDVYSAKEVEDTIIALTEQRRRAGYAFAQVTPRGDRNFENHTISVVYTIDQGTARLCRAHRNPRQRPHARLCHPPRVRRQRRRRLQPGSDPARQAAAGSAGLF